ncbi:Citrate lyase ligase [uncultured delta proteobacterium]|uniref:[Citrate [pro-3S]-lyase] ligase n=1 Tax=uncultured delta proteobacterium TaxID=34034 RepID=A0A212KBF4_9DELT|nr:Citrate lyase ligase [uncultured delta proteobacterium]
MSEQFRVEYVNLQRERTVAEIKQFLERFDLGFDADVDFTVAVRDPEGTLVGTGSSQGEVLRNIAVDETIQGEGLTSTILSTLMQEMGRRGILHYFIYTRPEKSFLFANLGFAEIARAEPYAALLESGLGSVASYCETIARETAHLPARRAGLVINGNPFTKGHRALIEKAAAECPAAIVFVVSEDRSLFPFADRLRLITEGVADLANVAVVEGGKYIISAATFPTYFTREQDHVKAQTRLDATLFARQIAPRLGITDRYIGEEPYCPVTAAYHEALREILPDAGVRVHTMPRIAVAGEVVSASKVRDMIRTDDWAGLEMLLPPVTLDFLRSERNKSILETIRSSDTRH